MLSRRALLTGCSALLCSCSRLRSNEERVAGELSTIRRRLGGRLGVHALDTGSGRRIALDDAAPFAMASTFKLLLAAAVLQRCERGELQLDDPDRGLH